MCDVLGSDELNEELTKLLSPKIVEIFSLSFLDSSSALFLWAHSLGLVFSRFIVQANDDGQVTTLTVRIDQNDLPDEEGRKPKKIHLLITLIYRGVAYQPEPTFYAPRLEAGKREFWRERDELRAFLRPIFHAVFGPALEAWLRGQALKSTAI